ncbi:glutamate--cysteine ligase [Calothrix sp. UHCC 0171]|uniref:glutamate--cysteine ligase n=1 Tax=Calothrix sp. UHCC 0171 TaxID=3110245 RepID=UPI002B1FF772|nr:glutamate--cysteine ligase [Calothrix sp. UHCC 0171]MEA5570063.1 glutamate--cysteine ligase [Calothrix sp. UHCC 0171]
MFYFGIEHEVAFVDFAGNFVDFSRAKFADFNQIIAALPEYANDSLYLHMGDAGIRKKRWYIEGFERFGLNEEFVECVPKGIEIRTTIHSSIQNTIWELNESFCLLRDVAAKFGLLPVLISYNPALTAYEPQPPLNAYELSELQAYPDEQTVNIYMVSYGPDLNISLADLPVEKVIQIGQKLTYYSPYIVPFSYSSPFYQGSLWEGLSVRTFIRTGKRAATRVFVEKPEQLISSIPALTKIARLPAEIGRIEFKSCDSCDDFSIYAGILALLKGLILDHSLPGYAIAPNPAMHQLSAREAFDNEEIYNTASQIIQAAEIALANDPDINLLTPLKNMLEKRQTPAHQMIRTFNSLGSIEHTLMQTYSSFR